ncbi:RagB/SusD family nutrient uptake outer membrane protein [Sinomicrobium weinanense]|uniref:RagB/SusD family nutrient uptake outer membrane protein n=1 Tax=Sinomicrobium weinanense TaxID=2842200 RepID=A0A926Q0C1_9FLAO|nr:RagB/SusD family nutrient uptake outer membrane protein [Sinomicrobium weinanense]MBC9794782.1 RagB/SusD family nutrient uptake outer membrane protein [Sinomicrobium weinanense]MBU3125041.1 RagB/SusD family nutrient uptake outer membrane protein [Sinomicrobium weinanense]
MKKGIKYTVAGMVAAIVLNTSSCSDDFSNLGPEGGPSYENFWKNEQDAISAVNSMYSEMHEEEVFSRGMFWYINASDDMVTGRINADPDNIKNFVATGDEGYTSYMYPAAFRVIRRANDVLKNVPEMEISETLKNRLLGEAYFMRGFFYFWLAHSYGDDGKNGGIPIVTVENMDNVAGNYTRPESVIANYEQIIRDLDKAAELLPLFTELSAEDYGRAHKDAALAYAAKTYLYWAQYDASKYAEVVAYCDAVTSSGSGRALVDNNKPGEDFRLLHSHLNNWTSEYIWSVNSGVDNGSKLPGVMLENKGWSKYNGWGYFQPTEELYEAYEANDPRREVTILKFGDEFQFFGENRKYYSENSLSGFQFNKYMYEYGYESPIGTYINSNGNNPTTVYNVPLLRYAEVLLMKSEALIMQGLNGDVPLNLVRDRAGLDAVTGATMDDLKHERRVELAGEFANRHFDLVRWGDAQEVYSRALHGRIHSNKADPDSGYTVKEIWKARSFDPSYMHVWPLPTTVVEGSGIPQNAGW